MKHQSIGMNNGLGRLSLLWFLCATILQARVSKASIAFGALSNFDVINDENEVCHGFEIELEGIRKEDIISTFGGTYSRYGDPIKVDKVDNFGAIVGAYVRYQSSIDSNGNFLQVTAVPPAVNRSTDGHSCYNGGPIGAEYNLSGCEHFGVSFGYAKQPSKTSYRWLKADPNNRGQLIASTNNVDIPGVTWNQLPAVPPQNGLPAQNPVNVNRVVVEIPDPPNPACTFFGHAKWVQVTVTQTEYEVELDMLLSDNKVIEETETEIEWMLLQALPTCDSGEGGLFEPPENKHEIEDAAVSDLTKSIVRRFAFYKYAGEYDPENNEALPVSDSSPVDGDIGDYIGAQMAAVQLAPVGDLPLDPILPSTVAGTTVDSMTVGTTTVDATTGDATTGDATTTIATTVDATTAGSTTVDATTVVASTTVDATTVVASTTVDATTIVASTTVDATTIVASTTVDATTVVASTTLDATTVVASMTLDATTVDVTTLLATTADATTLPATTADATTLPATTADAITSTWTSNNEITTVSSSPDAPVSSPWRYTEPSWWPLIQEVLGPTTNNIKRCRKRQLSPTNGMVCSTVPKTCFFGNQECARNGVYPTTSCFCSGGSGGGTWACESLSCP